MQQLTVSSLVRYLKNKIDLDNNLQHLLVQGEISNFHRHFSGHLYFTLKDESSAINCVMFKSSAISLKFEPKNGDKVLINANTSIFETSGQLQLYVTKMSLDGLGDLYAKYEALKNKLIELGIFDDDHKKQLTKEYIEKVCVLVGDKSAAMSDIKTTFNRRWPLCKVDYYPVLVQGDNAPKQIIEKLLEVDELNYDAIILARGGGSFEDLFCFNDENLVMTIYNLKTFIITGIGHEQDFTLCDFVADKRAATPTASVELITPNIEDVLQEIDDLEYSIKQSMFNKLNNIRLTIDYNFERLIKFNNHIKQIINNVDHNILIIKNRLNEKYQAITLNLKRYSTLLEAYSLNNTLKRGFTLVIQDNKVVKSYKDVKDKSFEVKFADGSIKAIKE